MEGKTKANAAKEKENKDRSSKMVIVKNLIEKGIIDLTDHDYVTSDEVNLYSKETGQIYDVNMRIIDSDLKNGSRLILL